MIRYEISADPQFYGYDATDEDGERCARIISKRLAAMYQDIEFPVVDGWPNEDLPPEYADIAEEIHQIVNDNWIDWIA